MAVSTLRTLAMAASTLRTIALLALVLPASMAGAAGHVEQQNVVLEAAYSEMDLKSNNVIFHKAHISQGNMSIAADQAQGSGLDFDNSHWVFRGNVKIIMEQGTLTSDEADITFAKKLLSKAVVNGKPAVFEQKLAKLGKTAKGHADSIDYDVAKGIVHFSKSAWLSDGDREIQGESLKYNMLTQTIIAEASEQASQRVHIIITPPPKSKP